MAWAPAPGVEALLYPGLLGWAPAPSQPQVMSKTQCQVAPGTAFPPRISACPSSTVPTGYKTNLLIGSSNPIPTQPWGQMGPSEDSPFATGKSDH